MVGTCRVASRCALSIFSSCLLVLEKAFWHTLSGFSSIATLAMATTEKLPGEGLFQASDITYDESLLHNTKSSAADARDMARMGKPQEMKV